MDTKLLNSVTSEYTKVKHPDFKVGDIIEVHTKIREDGKERIQVFKGIVIGIKGGGSSKSFTIRKISYGIGVEKIFPFYSPNISSIKIVKQAKGIRRSKLYYLRKRVGKRALKAGLQVPAEGENLETLFEKEEEEKVESEKESEKDSSTSSEQEEEVTEKSGKKEGKEKSSSSEEKEEKEKEKEKE